MIFGADDSDAIMEILANFGDQELMHDIRESEYGTVFTLDEVTEEMCAAGRLPR